MAKKFRPPKLTRGSKCRLVRMMPVAARTKPPMDLDASTEALRHAAEDTPSGALPDDLETVPVFDRADLAPKI